MQPTWQGLLTCRKLGKLAGREERKKERMGKKKNGRKKWREEGEREVNEAKGFKREKKGK